MSFKEKNYLVIKKAIPKDMAEFLFNYFLIKKQVLLTFRDLRFISEKDHTFGEMGDGQTGKNTFCLYGDVAGDTLLLRLHSLMEKTTGIKLQPNNSYMRIYVKGDELKRHTDRFSCEISTTLHLGGSKWPIYLEPLGKKGKRGVGINLEPGDMLIYKGCKLEHWRNKLKGKEHAQVFLHYNRVSSKTDLYDSRPHVGLPSSFARKAPAPGDKDEDRNI
jgi:hypothetical protein